MRQRLKRNLVVLTVLVFVGVAVYLNWRYASELPVSGKSDETGKVLGQSTLVSSDGGGAEAVDGGADLAGDQGSVNYFATARLTRQQARDSALALLREAAETGGEDTDAAAAASESIQVLAGYAIAEAQIENLVIAKGYKDCVAFMGDGGISVVVDAGEDGLQAVDAARITEIVLSETDYTAGEIKILEAA